MAAPTDPPSCPHFGACGGCTCLHTAISLQRAAKLQRVRRVLAAHLGDLDPDFTDPPVATPRHDRTRILYPVQPERGGLAMGLYRRGTHELIGIDSCATQHPALTELARRAAVIFRARGDTPYDEARHQGCLRAFSARIAPSTGELLLGLVTAEDRLAGAAELAGDLLGAAQGLPGEAAAAIHPVGVVHNVNPQRGNALLGPTVHTLWGRDHLFEAAGDLRYRVGFLSFHQLHRHADRLLYRPALAMLGGLRGARVVDGFGGVGTFALRVARQGAARVTLVELHPSACADARHNVTANSVDAAVQVLEAAFERCELPASADLLIVDPTRAGLRPSGCAQVRRLAAPRVLYVACGLDALRRDLDALPEYRLEQLRLADLFPHTDHVELLALLTRR